MSEAPDVLSLQVIIMSCGEMAEWSKAPDSKSGLGQPNGGSNPSLSARTLLYGRPSGDARAGRIRTPEAVRTCRAWARTVENAGTSERTTGANAAAMAYEPLTNRCLCDLRRVKKAVTATQYGSELSTFREAFSRLCLRPVPGRFLITLYASQSSPNHVCTPCGRDYPRAIRPRGIMTHVLIVAAFKLCHPVKLVVLMKGDDSSVHGLGLLEPH
jgi:hypothetical protein